MNARQLIESETDPDLDDRLERAFDLQYLAKIGDLKKRIDQEIPLAADVCAQEFIKDWNDDLGSWKRAFRYWFEDEFLDHPAMEKSLDLDFELAGLLGRDEDEDPPVYDKVKGLAYRILKKRYDK
jgi:hypothetical protein